MNLFFGIFLVLALFFPLSGGENEGKGVRVGVMLLPSTLSRREQERVRSAKFVARVKDFASSLGKGRKKVLPCRIRMQKGLGCVQIKCDGKSAEIFMEEDFSILSARREDLHLLAGWLLLTENGISPQQVKNREFYTSFLVSGVARRAFMDVERRSLPYPDYFPCAKTLASHGLFPSLARSLENPGETSWSSCMSLYSEYCELIFLAMLRSKGLNKTSFTKILFAIALQPEKSQKDHFFELLRMEKKGRKRKKVPEDGRVAEEALESWYSAFLNKVLQGPMQPVSLEKWEAAYRESTLFSADGVPGVRGYVTLSSASFPEVFRKMKDPDRKLYQVLRDLLLLGNVSTVALREDLTILRKTLLQYRKNGMKKADLEELLAAEKQLFRTLEKEYFFRDFLEETERKNFPPTLRYQRTLHASRKWEEKEHENMGKRFAALFAGAREALSGREGGRL